MHEKQSLSDLCDQVFLDTLDSWIDNRIGNALLLGAALPKLAAGLAEKGISLMVVESDRDRLALFQESLRRLGVDARRVNIDPRPYADIRFEASSYNLIMAWYGFPPDIPLNMFFKKARRELKAGSFLYARTPIRREDPLGLERRLEQGPLEKLLPLVRRLGSPLTRLLSLAEAPSLDELQQAAVKNLKIEEVLPGGGLLPVLLERSEAAAALPAPTGKLSDWLAAADQRLGEMAGSSLALLKASKTLDMGRVFLTGSRFDPRFSDDA